MQDFLRSIALLIDEPDPGCFCWVLLESKGSIERFEVLGTGQVVRDTYDAALRDGIAALRALRDGVHGPRTAISDTGTGNPSGWTPLA